MSVFGTIETARRALAAQQQALAVIGQNIANANTPGYSREVATLVAMPSIPAFGMDNRSDAGQVGMGVQVAEVRRLRDAFLDDQTRRESATQALWEARHHVLQGLEAVFNEPSDSGVAAALSRFWNAWQTLANTPDSPAARRSLVETAEGLARLLRGQTEQIQAIQHDAAGVVRADVTQINHLADQIAALNQAISMAAAAGSPANDLLDQRDLVLTQLSRLTRTTSVRMNDSTVTVYVGGRPLVSGVTALHMEVVAVGSAIAVQWQNDGMPVAAGGGEVQGALDALQTVLPAHAAALDELAAALITAVNERHAAGYDLQGAPGGAFFTGSRAGDIAVAPALRDNPALVAAASAPGGEGNGEMALQIAALQQARLLNAGAATLGSFYAELVAAVGAESRQAEALAATQRDLVAHLTERQEAVAGVSLDEEAAQLVRYQRAYEAAARLLTVVDELLDKLINGTGTVGR